MRVAFGWSQKETKQIPLSNVDPIRNKHVKPHTAGFPHIASISRVRGSENVSMSTTWSLRMTGTPMVRPFGFGDRPFRLGLVTPKDSMLRFPVPANRFGAPKHGFDFCRAVPYPKKGTEPKNKHKPRLPRVVDDKLHAYQLMISAVVGLPINLGSAKPTVSSERCCMTCCITPA